MTKRKNVTVSFTKEEQKLIDKGIISNRQRKEDFKKINLKRERIQIELNNLSSKARRALGMVVRYTPDIQKEVIEALADGSPLRKAMS